MSVALRELPVHEMPVVNGSGGLQGLNEKLDLLTRQVAFLTEQAEADRRRRQEWEDLQADLMPIVKDIYGVAVDEMSALQPYVEADDLVYLLRKLARNVRTFNELLGQVESVTDLMKDLVPLSHDAMGAAIAQMAVMEEKGYFGFLRQGMYVADQIVTSFSENDVRQLGDNVVLILNTVKALTQPEIMNLANNLTSAFEEVEDHAEELPTSLFGLLGQMRDPEVRRGLAVMMEVLKVISRQGRVRK